jgi:peptidoglycan endopeptidase LytE
MKSAEGGWSNMPPREYPGWSLPERSSAQMASVGGKLTWEDIRPGDLLFYDGDDDGVVDHANVYLGNSWAMDSSSGSGGVTLARVTDNWYEDHFVHARRITK